MTRQRPSHTYNTPSGAGGPQSTEPAHGLTITTLMSLRWWVERAELGLEMPRKAPWGEEFSFDISSTLGDPLTPRTLQSSHPPGSQRDLAPRGLTLPHPKQLFPAVGNFLPGWSGKRKPRLAPTTRGQASANAYRAALKPATEASAPSSR